MIKYIKTKMHYDQQALYDLFVNFMQNTDGVEVTNDDCLNAFKQAKIDTGYFQEGYFEDN